MHRLPKPLKSKLNDGKALNLKKRKEKESGNEGKEKQKGR